ncbi:MAG: SCP2 sterol-binding domain-containing protein [bacterium]|nr:SCP2 sterol-binding domain-containing protein [bacterium]
MSQLEEQDEFYRERIPEQFNRTLCAQRARADGDAAATRVLEEMEAVRTSIVVEVDTGDTFRRHAFEINRGEMGYVEEASSAPFMILGHSLEDFENLRRECGDSLLGFLGAIAGLGDEMRLTSRRVRSLVELAGSLVLERVGPGGFALFAHFGVEAPSPEPRARIRIDEATYAQLRAGVLDPQDAFLKGRVEVLGDEAMAIELALAALSPE